MNTVKFNTTKSDRSIISNIVTRAVKEAKEHGVDIDNMSLQMDLAATHLNGCPLRLQDLLDAEDFNFFHDVYGIVRHIDRSTGKMGDCFLPRFHS